MEHYKSIFKWTKIKTLVAYSSGRGEFFFTLYLWHCYDLGCCSSALILRFLRVNYLFSDSLTEEFLHSWKTTNIQNKTKMFHFTDAVHHTFASSCHSQKLPYFTAFEICCYFNWTAIKKHLGGCSLPEMICEMWRMVASQIFISKCQGRKFMWI